jgi:hypothetical protein
MTPETYKEHIVVAYNANSPRGAGGLLDEFLGTAQRAKKSIGYTGIKDLASKLGGAFGGGKISALLLVDHGAVGIQGVGSGTGQDLDKFKNLSAADFTVMTKIEASLPAIAKATTTMPLTAKGVMEALHITGMAGVDDWQLPHLRAIGGCIMWGGVLFLCGCSVAGSEQGKEMLRDLALFLQNSVSVVACRTYVTWLEDDRTTFRPARWQQNRAMAMGEYDLVGFVGARTLTRNELKWIIDNTVVQRE